MTVHDLKIYGITVFNILNRKVKYECFEELFLLIFLLSITNGHVLGNLTHWSKST